MKLQLHKQVVGSTAWRTAGGLLTSDVKAGDNGSHASAFYVPVLPNNFLP